MREPKPLILGKNNQKRVKRAWDCVKFAELLLRDFQTGELFYLDNNQEEQFQDLEIHLTAALELVRYIRANMGEGLGKEKKTDASKE